MKKHPENYFDRNEIIKKCNKITDLVKQIDYLKEIKHQYITEPPVMDVNLLLPNEMGLVEYLDIQIEYRKEKIEVSVENKATTNVVDKIKLVDGKGYSDIVRIFEAMKKSEIIDKGTKVTEIAQLFFEKKDTFSGKYYSTKSTNKNYNSNSISEKLYEFITIVIKEAYQNRQNKRDELVEFIEKL